MIIKIMEIQKLRDEAYALTQQSQQALNDNDVEKSLGLSGEAAQLLEKADKAQEASDQIKRLAAKSSDIVEVKNDTPAVEKLQLVAQEQQEGGKAHLSNSYKSAAWNEGLPAMAQQPFVLKNSGSDYKEIAEIQKQAHSLWMRSKSDAEFESRAKATNPQLIKALNEGTDSQGKVENLPRVLVTV
tara:strand:+ start:427 stop:981 length:555 start_codon:yes stop_codon:yes gene_type:complete